ncbi:MAG TPA: histidine kinase [Chitinophagaceae bacterium]
MGHPKVELNDRWFRIIGIPLIAYMSHVIFFNENHGSPDEGFSSWQVILISAAEALILWEGNRLVLIFCRSRYPELTQSRQRILSQFTGCMLATILIRYANIWFYDQTLFWGYMFPPEGYLYSIFVGLLYVIIVAGVYEGLYYFHKWKQLFSEAEALKRENLQTQLDSLKTQINPHFLFNNLGSLSSLIIEDPARAVTFVNELSSVYRYLLQANERQLTTLKSELAFLRDYFHLLKTRFGDALHLEVDIEDHQFPRLLPPLTLQLLIENAVKHNIVLPQKPLHIRLYTDEEDNLVVVNNLQKKASPVLSNKVGLRTIISKYRLLNRGAVQVAETATYFRVTLPLVKNNVYETISS